MMIPRKHYPMKCDIKENKNHYLLEIDLPGFSKENLKASVDNGYLIVTATQDKESQSEEKKFIRRERYHGEMTRRFYIGKAVKQDDIRALYQHGVLKFVIPRPDKKQIEEQGKISIA